MTPSRWLAVGLLAAAAAGCASLQARRERTRRLQAQLDEFRYARPLDEVWLEARRLLADRGYPLAGEDAKSVGQPEMEFGDRVLSPAKETYPYGEETGLLQRLGVVGGGRKGDPTGRSLDTGWRRTRDRYHVDGFQDSRGCRVVFTRVVEDPTEHRAQRERDFEMELDLARRVDADGAARVDAAVARGKSSSPAVP